MAAVKGSNTQPERVVRSLLHRMGFRFRLHAATLPGKPDIVLPKYRTVVLVHGCFWHQHPGCRKATIPVANYDYWERKLAGNVQRDARTRHALQQAGWRVLTVWTCETGARSRDALGQRLRSEIIEE